MVRKMTDIENNRIAELQAKGNHTTEEKQELINLNTKRNAEPSTGVFGSVLSRAKELVAALESLQNSPNPTDGDLFTQAEADLVLADLKTLMDKVQAQVGK